MIITMLRSLLTCADVYNQISCKQGYFFCIGSLFNIAPQNLFVKYQDCNGGVRRLCSIIFRLSISLQYAQSVIFTYKCDVLSEKSGQEYYNKNNFRSFFNIFFGIKYNIFQASSESLIFIVA